VVTGGGSGIGEAISVRLAAEGARVAPIDINLSAAKLTASLVGDGLAVGADVTDSGAVEAALAEVEAALGPVDVWVNNAGIAGPLHVKRVNERAAAQLAEASGGEIKTPLDALVRIDDEEWAAMLAVHLSGTFYGMRAAARSMTERSRGCIVNIASICGIEGCTGHPHYSAAKAGILGLTRSAAKELIRQGVRVNAIAPGYIETPLLTGSVSASELQLLARDTPIARLGRPDEIAAAAAFLASEDATFCVGETLSPNGGFLTV
jgi:3-oxoacyl-[acyl-carrier protein] reductase